MSQDNDKFKVGMERMSWKRLSRKDQSRGRETSVIIGAEEDEDIS